MASAEQFAHLVRAHLDKADLSQAEIARGMAAILGSFDRANLTRWKNGTIEQPREAHLLAFARVLKLSPAERNGLLRTAGYLAVPPPNQGSSTTEPNSVSSAYHDCSEQPPLLVTEDRSADPDSPDPRGDRSWPLPADALKPLPVGTEVSKGGVTRLALVGGLSVLVLSLLLLAVTQPLVNPQTKSSGTAAASTPEPQTDYVLTLVDLAPGPNPPLSLQAADGHPIPSGGQVRLGEPVTATLTVRNDKGHVIRLNSLEVGGRYHYGCTETELPKKWAGDAYGFPVAANLVLHPGEQYTYRVTRVFMKPGPYFVEPTYVGDNNRRGGFSPAPCTDFTVIP